MLCIFAIRKVSQNLLFVCFDTTEPIQTEELEFLPNIAIIKPSIQQSPGA